jgi:hypothetical protein
MLAGKGNDYSTCTLCYHYPEVNLMKALVSVLFVLALGTAVSTQACEYMNKLTQVTKQTVTEGSSPVAADSKQPLIVVTDTEKQVETSN